MDLCGGAGWCYQRGPGPRIGPSSTTGDPTRSSLFLWMIPFRSKALALYLVSACWFISVFYHSKDSVSVAINTTVHTVNLFRSGPALYKHGEARKKYRHRSDDGVPLAIPFYEWLLAWLSCSFLLAKLPRCAWMGNSIAEAALFGPSLVMTLPVWVS